MFIQLISATGPSSPAVQCMERWRHIQQQRPSYLDSQTPEDEDRGLLPHAEQRGPGGGVAPRPPAPVRGEHGGEARAVAEHHVGGRGDGGGVVGEAEAGVGAVEAPGGGRGHVLDEQPGQEHGHQAHPVQHQPPRQPLQAVSSVE